MPTPNLDVPGVAEAIAAAEAEAANPTPKPADIAAAEAGLAAWRKKTPAEQEAAYQKAADDLASGRVQPEGLHRRT